MNRRNEGLTIDLPDDRQDSGGQVDASVYTLAAVFGSVALPPDLPEYLKAEIEDRADADRRAAQKSGFVIADNTDLVDGKTRREREQDDDDNIQSYVSNNLQREEERQREEWSRTRSTVGGVTMTGAEWAQFADRLRNDDDLRRRLIETFERNGATHDEAEQRVDRAAQAAEAAAIPPSQRTDDQKKLLRDSQVGADLQTANGFREKGVPASNLRSSFETAANGIPDPQLTATQAPIPRPVTVAPGMGF